MILIPLAVFDIDDMCAHVVKTLCAALNEEDWREDDCLDKWNAVSYLEGMVNCTYCATFTT
jgi:hypothetical protein